MPLKSVSNPVPVLEAIRGDILVRTPAHIGAASSESSRSAKYLVGKGKAEPLQRVRAPIGMESIIGTDDRVRILDTDLTPWRMICSLEMRGPSSSSVIGTGWLAGPRTVMTA